MGAPGNAEAVGRAAEQAAEQDLVERVRLGDEAAFRSLYERYFRRIFNFVHKRLHNRADTEETVQEVFVNLFSSIHTYRGDAPFGAWVFGLTRRTIAGRFKKKRHETVPLESEETQSVDSSSSVLTRQPDPLEAYECRERLGRLDAALSDDLSDEQRQVFRLHHLQHHSIQEIARSISKSEDAVKSNLYRARKLLLAR